MCESCWTLSPLLSYHCLSPVSVLAEGSLRLANADVYLYESALKISSVSDASEWELHAACSMV